MLMEHQKKDKNDRNRINEKSQNFKKNPLNKPVC